MLIRSHATQNQRQGQLRIVEGEVVWTARGVGAPDVLVPSEYAPVLAVDLPLAQHRMRQAAAPFAVEDRVSQPLSELLVVVGPDIGARRYLVGVAANERMAGWRTALANGNITAGRIIPDASLLPPPSDQQTWTVKVEGERVLIRTHALEAFATSRRMFEELWRAAGRPALEQVSDGALPEGLTTSVHHADAEGARDNRFAVDLLIDASAGVGRRYAGAMKIAAGIIAAAVAAHTLILGADTAFVSRGAAERKAEITRRLAELAPLAPQGRDPAAALAGILPEGGAGANESGFLRLLSRVSASLQPVSQGLAVQALSYDDADTSLKLKVEASDLPTLERIEKTLVDAGFAAQGEGASASDGRAESSITIRDASAQ